MADKSEKKEKKQNAIQRWWRETIGELRKVSWPTTQEAWRLTRIVLLVMAVMSALLGILDFAFFQADHLAAGVRLIRLARYFRKQAFYGYGRVRSNRPGCAASA